MKKISFILLAVLSIAFYACTKVNETKINDNNGDIFSGKSVGEIHNELLDVLMRHPDFMKLDQKKCFKIMGDYLSEKYNQPRNIDYNAIFEKSKNSPKKIMFGIYNADLMEVLKNSKTAKEFLQKSNMVKANIIANSRILSDEKLVTLNSLSIMQKSFEYWEKAFKDKDNLWLKLRHAFEQQNQNTSNRNEPQAWCSRDDFLCIAAADAVGYSDSYYAVYNGNNHGYANSVGLTGAAYLSGVAVGGTMHPNP